MTIDDAKYMVEASKETRLTTLQKQMIWESANYQVVTEQFGRLAQATQTLLKFFHAVEHDMEKVWKLDPIRAKLLASVQAAHDQAKALLGPVSMIKPSDIFGEIEAANGQSAGQAGNATCCQGDGAEEHHECGCRA